MSKGNIRIAIDKGGTFTDCVGNIGTGKQEHDIVIKLLSVDPKNYADAPLEGIRRLLQLLENKTIPRGIPLNICNVKSLRMGTTLHANCAVERNGERCAFIIQRDLRILC
ncbi:OXP1-like protein [Saccharomyces kudriavzevii IFO 1802]|uniref:OXP1-like protein n=1 Tax=Saccharomyces kudriavzevii (strain ATCC MYA-4449 / AS 2.2408 / CBS 8840 / NBRC 1802 / NCYC 2889) TaxID=226230 RepID=J8TWV2_SACK1|nr:OXP1-like protein [Saccharomyces kudriavzevii IFO 1802]